MGVIIAIATIMTIIRIIAAADLCAGLRSSRLSQQPPRGYRQDALGCEGAP